MLLKIDLPKHLRDVLATCFDDQYIYNTGQELSSAWV